MPTSSEAKKLDERWASNKSIEAGPLSEVKSKRCFAGGIWVKVRSRAKMLRFALKRRLCHAHPSLLWTRGADVLQTFFISSTTFKKLGMVMCTFHLVHFWWLQVSWYFSIATPEASNSRTSNSHLFRIVLVSVMLSISLAMGARRNSASSRSCFQDTVANLLILACRS